MTQNIGKIDRLLRIIVGLAILSLTVVGPHTLWGLLGLIPLGTALIGWCPPYAMLGINTCGTKSSSMS
ncbi:YgaP family membrane protein [Bradyrhizobium sp. HKCCYLS2058]|uniref:YgaP family membrane protein n=1 Tax=unclassified Bradyrhizobium TaxID=2631580 RepID=UPI003EBFF1A1